MSKQNETSSHDSGAVDYLPSLALSFNNNEIGGSESADDPSSVREEDLVTFNKEADVYIRTKGTSPSTSLQIRHSTGSFSNMPSVWRRWLY